MSTISQIKAEMLGEGCKLGSSPLLANTSTLHPNIFEELYSNMP
jgi:hypothetical protein